MNDAVMTAIAGAVATFVPYALFLAIAERVVGILVRAFSGKERFF